MDEFEAERWSNEGSFHGASQLLKDAFYVHICSQDMNDNGLDGKYLIVRTKNL